jgi:RsiW-degrading membrane proteinase PrsW (M82 family)
MIDWLAQALKPIESLNLEPLAWAFATGFLAAFVWLWFWLKEDESPEPRRLIILAFVGGMLAIPLALVMQCSWLSGVLEYIHYTDTDCTKGVPTDISSNISLVLLVGFAAIEEFVKYLSVLILIFWRREYDEPADAMIYLITAALGFAAVENAFYLWNPFQTALLHGFTTANLRFLGPTLLHTLSSGVFGYFIAKAFLSSWLREEFDALLGFLAATVLHSLFNIFILSSEGHRIEPALLLLIVSGIFILFSFERIKHTIRKYYAKG